MSSYDRTIDKFVVRMSLETMRLPMLTQKIIESKIPISKVNRVYRADEVLAAIEEGV